MNDVISFIVMGIPQPRGSKVSIPAYEEILDARGNTIPHPITGKPRRRVKMDPRTDRAIIYTVDDNKKSGPWMQKIKRGAKAIMGDREPVKVPVKLTLDFYIERPQYHFGTGKNAGILKSQFVNAKHTAKPDRLKFARAVEDALEGIAYENDSQTIDGPVRKHYCAPGELPRVEIQIEIAAAVPATQRSLLV